jgi:putative addiction module component (TIGR02574 family)
MNTALRDQAMQLSPAERIELARDLWDSIPADSDTFQLTDEQKTEIARRMAEHEQDASRAIPWEEVRERLRAKYG